jgi:hypothetical protein
MQLGAKAEAEALNNQEDSTVSSMAKTQHTQPRIARRPRQQKTECLGTPR